MSGFFVNPWFLLGLAGVAIPIIIHILTRDRIRKVAFSTLRFFVQGARVTLRRKRWAEMIIIALRVLVCVLAALTFARPFLRARGGANGPSYSQARMIVADVSASMRRAGGAAALAAEVRKAADLPAGSAVGLLAFDHAVREVAPLEGDARPVLEAAKSLTPGEGGTDLAAALKQANEALRRVTSSRKDIVVISDLQRSGFDSYKGDWKLEPGVVLQIALLASAPAAADVGLTDAQVPQSLALDNQPRAVVVRLVNRGTNDLQDVPIVLRMNDRDVERQTVRLPAGASVPARFWHIFDKAGDNSAEVRVLCDDADPGGSRYFFNARVLPEIPVLVVAKTAGGQGGAAFFVETALNPGTGTPFAVKARTAATVRPEDVVAASVMVLVDVATLEPAVVAAATRLLERGGGVLFLPGDGVTSEAFWATWSAVAPCRLKRAMTRRSPEGSAEGTLAKVDQTASVFEAFQRPHFGDFSTVRFARYWDVSESQASRVLARYDDGRPAILERQVGQGLCTIWLSPPDPAWNNLPLRSIFLPLLHETVRQSAVHTEWQTTSAVGQTPPLPPGYSLKESGSTISKTAATPTDLGPGFHVLTNTEGQAICLAINRPFGEADGARLKPEELKAALERPTAPDGSGAAAGPGASNAGAREWWWWLAMALALLLPAELWLANRTARH